MNINKEIVARAMDKAGEEPITKEEWEANKSTRIRLIKDYYLATILETLANTSWTSQKKRTQLISQAEQPNLTSYLFMYELPIDCAKPIEINGVQEYLVEDGFIYTNVENPILVYISNHFTGEYRYQEEKVTIDTFNAGIFYILDEIDYLALEVADGDVVVVSGHIHSHEVAGFGVEAVNARASSSRGANLTLIPEEAFSNEFGNEFGDSGYTDAEVAAEISNTVVAVFDAQFQDISFDCCVLAAGITQECGHSVNSDSYPRKNKKKLFIFVLKNEIL